MEKKLDDVLGRSLESLRDGIDALSPEEKKDLRKKIHDYLSRTKSKGGKIMHGKDEVNMSEISDAFEILGGDSKENQDKETRDIVDDARLYAVLGGRLGKKETKRFIEDIKLRSGQIIKDTKEEVDKLEEHDVLDTLIGKAKDLEGSEKEYELGDIEKKINDLEAYRSRYGGLSSNQQKNLEKLTKRKEDLEKEGIKSKPKPTADSLMADFPDIFNEDNAEKYGLTKEYVKELKKHKERITLREIKKILSEAKQRREKLEETIKFEGTKKKLLDDKEADILEMATLNETEAEAIQEASKKAGDEFEWTSRRRATISNRQMRDVLRDKYQGETGLKGFLNFLKIARLSGKTKKEAMEIIEEEERALAMRRAGRKARDNSLNEEQKSRREEIQGIVGEVVKTGEYKRKSKSGKVFHGNHDEHDDDEGR